MSQQREASESKPASVEHIVHEQPALVGHRLKEIRRHDREHDCDEPERGSVAKPRVRSLSHVPSSMKSDISATLCAYPIQDDFNLHDASFRRHFQLNYSSGPHQYETFYAPAYRYGYLLSADNPKGIWDEIERQAREHWPAQHPGSWHDVVDAVRYGWTEKHQPSMLQVRHPGQFEDYEPAFRQHLADSLLGFGASFEDYEPVYRYGYALAIDPANRTCFWSDMEPEVRIMWEQGYQGHFLWEDFRDVVRRAWQEVRNGPEIGGQ